MSRSLKIVAIALLLAVTPLRGLAAVTIGFCAMGDHPAAGAAAEAHGVPAHGGHHDHGSAPEPASTADCNTCVEHCSSASFAVPAPVGAALAVEGAARIASGEPFAAGFVPDHLDPPPLAL